MLQFNELYDKPTNIYTCLMEEQVHMSHMQNLQNHTTIS